MMLTLLVILIMCVDTIFVGVFFGVDDLRAMGVIAPVILCILLIGIVIEKVSLSSAKKKGDANESQRFSLAVIVTLLLGIALSALGYVFLSQLTELIGIGMQSREIVLQYFHGFVMGVTPLMMLPVLSEQVNKQGSKNICSLCMAGMLLMNIVLSLIGSLTCSHSIFALALAASYSYLMIAVVLVIYLRKHMMHPLKLLNWHFSRGKHEKNIDCQQPLNIIELEEV